MMGDGGGKEGEGGGKRNTVKAGIERCTHIQ